METRLFVITVTTIMSVILSACGNAQVNNLVTAVEQTITMPTGHWYIGKIDPNCTINFRVTRVNDADTLLIEQYIGNNNETRITPVSIGGQFMASCALTTLQVDTVIEGNLTKVTRLYNPIEGIEYELLEKGGDPVVVPEGKNLGTIEYIPIDQDVEMSIPAEDPTQFQEIYDLENEIFNYWDTRIQSETLKKKEFENLASDGLSVGLADIVVRDGQVKIVPNENSVNADILIPIISYPAGNMQLQSFAVGIQEFATQGNAWWFKTFHWAVELKKLGGNPYDLGAATSLMYKVFRGASESNTFYQLGSRVLAISKIDGRNIAIILDKSGAAVTTIWADYRHGKSNPGEAGRYLNSKLAQGWTQMTRDQLPAGIQQYWRDASKPPTLRVIGWSLLYQARMAAAFYKIAFVQALTQTATMYGRGTTDFVILVVPPCTDMLPSFCPFAETPGT